MTPTAVADAPETNAPEGALQTADDVFVSRREDLRLVKKAAEDRYNAGGERIQRLPGEVLRFREGLLVVPKKGTIKLEDGRPIKVEDVRKFLAEHLLNGDVEEGFFPRPTIAPQPTGAEIEKLLGLAREHDVAGLERFIAEESEGYAREELLGAARLTLERFAPSEQK